MPGRRHKDNHMGRYGEAIERKISWCNQVEEAKIRLFNRAAELGYSTEEILSPSRRMPLPAIRMSIAYKLCKIGVDVYEVARILNRDRTTILFYNRCVEEKYQYDRKLAEVFEKLIRK